MFQPKQLGRGVARQHRVADLLDQPFRSAEFLVEFFALRLGRDVAPELGRPERIARFVERDEAVLLAAHPDRFDLAAPFAQFFETFGDGFGGGVDPDSRILFDMPGRQALDRAVGALRERDDFAGLDIEDQRLRALGAAIDSETKHKVKISERCRI